MFGLCITRVSSIQKKYEYMKFILDERGRRFWLQPSLNHGGYLGGLKSGRTDHFDKTPATDSDIMRFEPHSLFTKIGAPCFLNKPPRFAATA
jgi:hypothetical protein